MIMNSEVGKIWEETVIAYFKILAGRIRKTMKTLSQDRQALF
jgi:hypothetical protein